MRAKAHIRILATALLAWAAFLVAGLPDYYQQYSFTAMLAFSILLVPIIAVIGVKVIGSAKVQQRRPLAFWLAFYFTVPLAILDYLYCGLRLGHGLGFLSSYWYLTVFYVVPWVILVPIGFWTTRPPDQAMIAT